MRSKWYSRQYQCTKTGFKSLSVSSRRHFLQSGDSVYKYFRFRKSSPI